MSALRHAHFIAIGGTGMGSLAGLLKARGLEVTGSDHALYPPMSTALKDWGIEAIEGFRPENVLSRKPDLVVIGNAVRRDNPEALAAIEAGLAYRSFSDALYELAMASKHSISVSGTHGKTTTTSLLAYLLHSTGRDPSFLVGGIALDFGGSFREGEGEHFVVEGDEYDTAFFDKTPKFLHYHPRTAILTSVEFDHADIYEDLNAVKSAFRGLVALVPTDGSLVAAWNHANVREVVAGADCRVLRYAVEADDSPLDVGELDFYADDLRVEPGGTGFRLSAPGWAGDFSGLHRGERLSRLIYSPSSRISRAASIAAWVTACRTCDRSPVTRSVRARSPEGVLTAMQAVPAGIPSWSSGPAAPVVPIPTVAPNRERAPWARARATSSVTIPCLSNSTGTFSTSVLTSGA